MNPKSSIPLRPLEISSVLTLSVAAVLSGGCGLVVVPHVTDFPGEIRTVRVVDATSGDDIASANLRYEIVRHTNWTHSPPRLRSDGGDKAAEPAVESLDVQRVSRGFQIMPCRKTGSMQWFFPLPLPLGWTLYRDYEAVVTASAPGRRTIAIQYSPDATRQSWPRMTDDASYVELRDGALCIGLKSVTR